MVDSCGSNSLEHPNPIEKGTSTRNAPFITPQKRRIQAACAGSCSCNALSRTKWMTHPNFTSSLLSFFCIDIAGDTLISLYNPSVSFQASLMLQLTIQCLLFPNVVLTLFSYYAHTDTQLHAIWFFSRGLEHPACSRCLRLCALIHLPYIMTWYIVWCSWIFYYMMIFEHIVRIRYIHTHIHAFSQPLPNDACLAFVQTCGEQMFQAAPSSLDKDFICDRGSLLCAAQRFSWQAETFCWSTSTNSKVHLFQPQCTPLTWHTRLPNSLQSGVSYSST